MTEPTNKELDAVIKHHRTRIYPQDMQPHFERAIMRAVLAKWGQPAQAAEPVAWAATSEDGVVEALGMNQSRRFDTPLYLAPQPVAREPLTHAQAKALVSKYGNDPLHLVYQVEAAHGIKGGQHGTDT